MAKSAGGGGMAGRVGQQSRAYGSNFRVTTGARSGLHGRDRIRETAKIISKQIDELRGTPRWGRPFGVRAGTLMDRKMMLTRMLSRHDRARNMETVIRSDARRNDEPRFRGLVARVAILKNRANKLGNYQKKKARSYGDMIVGTMAGERRQAADGRVY